MVVEAKGLTKHFNRRTIFSDISFHLEDGESLVITGPNGSGKSTLVKIISGLLTPTSGTIEFYNDGKLLPAEVKYHQLGLVSPYLQLYKDLTAWENLTFFARTRDSKVDESRLKMLLKRVGLGGREHDELKTYSSGMIQRIKYVAALYHQPRILILDEPTANLDEKGAKIVYEIIKEQTSRHILIIATNEPDEVKFGMKHVELG
ncbi:MAG: ABC transporter ATP-binding protein [Calditrichaeota bacterium]|nr:MAG: ABC transporter ATP-binding protein [Calditrichota bacterium]